MAEDLLDRGIATVSLRFKNIRQPEQAPTLEMIKDKFPPLYGQNYYGTPDEQNSPLSITNAVEVPLEHITTLALKPGERGFLLWYSISSMFPLIAACASPLANLISLIGLIELWRRDKSTQLLVKDRPRMIVLNALSFACGVFGNASLLADFTGTVKYTISLAVSIFCFLAASMFLLAMVLVTNREFVGADPQYIRSEGFWFAVFTIGLYFCCCLLLAINYMGSRLKKYPPQFNLDQKQTTLMMYTICLCLWLMVGSIVMKFLIKELTYGASLYYCVVSVLTIGLGDITPKSIGARIFALIFSFIGVMLIGLIIAMIRQVVLSSRGPMFFWHILEKKRARRLKKLLANDDVITSEQAFHEMRVIREEAKIRQVNTLLISSFMVFLIYWLIGACVFHYTESTWTYFDSIYFCMLCLFTIGYGDYAPKSPLGRAFFVVWSISAVPLMTILISSAGDKLFELADVIGTIMEKAFDVQAHVQRVVRTARRTKSEDEEDLTEQTVDRFEDNEAELLEAIMEGSQDEEEDELVSPQESENIDKSIDTGIDLGKSIGTETGIDLGRSIGTVTGIDSLSTDNSGERLRVRAAQHKKSLLDLLHFLKRMKPLISDSIEEPTKKYDHTYWQESMKIIGTGRSTSSNGDDLFWIGDKSPLRLPLKEPNYIITKMFFRIEAEIKKLVEDEMVLLNELQPDN